MKNTINNIDDIITCLDEINKYVSFIIYYNSCSFFEQRGLDLNKILEYLSTVKGTINDIKDYLLNISNN